MTQEQHDGLKLMEEIGGGFASRLAAAWFHADPSNSARLFSVFGDLLEEYVNMAKSVAVTRKA